MWNYWRRSERQRTEPEHLHSCQREFKVYSDETRAGDGWNSESENKVCLRCLNHFCKQSVVTLVRASTTKTFNCVGICFTWSDNLSLSTTNTNTLTGSQAAVVRLNIGPISSNVVPISPFSWVCRGLVLPPRVCVWCGAFTRDQQSLFTDIISWIWCQGSV